MYGLEPAIAAFTLLAGIIVIIETLKDTVVEIDSTTAISVVALIIEFSITDDDRGNILATIVRDGSNYDIALQLNKFETNGKLLRDTMPLNIGDSYVTGNIAMKTSGHIAHDIEYNLNGNIDLTFTGGYVYGIGTDAFYASADSITILNAEDALIYALNAPSLYPNWNTVFSASVVT